MKPHTGTTGALTGEVVFAPLFASWEDEDRYDLPKVVARIQKFSDENRGRLKGKVVMIEPARALAAPTEPPSQRYDDAKLASMAAAPDPFASPAYEWPLTGLPPDPKKRRQLFEALPEEVSEDYFMQVLAARAKLNALPPGRGCPRRPRHRPARPGRRLLRRAGGSLGGGGPRASPIVVLAPEP